MRNIKGPFVDLRSFWFFLKPVAPLAIVILWLCSAALAQNVSYIYDGLGRLAGVVDQNGNAAQYSYDAVGNLLSINRFTSTQVSIIQISPQTAPVGAVVTINGTGYSPTVGQDSVSFNGVPATISSPTANTLVVTVPSGATTGPIFVTSPNGSATSVSAFNVNTSSGTPTITSFRPTVGTPGTAITITGTNLDPAVANDKTKFGLTGTSATSATSTTVIAPVPSVAGSGHLTISTPMGKAISSQDFYIPYGGYQASDLGYANRTTLGSAVTVTASSSARPT